MPIRDTGKVCPLPVKGGIISPGAVWRIKARRASVSDIIGVNKSISQPTERGNESRKSAASIKSGEHRTAQLNNVLVEMQLKIKIEAKDLIGAQAGIAQFARSDETDLLPFEYNDKALTELTRNEAEELISTDGFFGVQNTAQRIFDFVGMVAGENPEKLQAARGAVLKGFREAEAAFGGILPEISHETIGRAVEMIDETIRGAGAPVVDIIV
jgi:hypothetical protein